MASMASEIGVNYEPFTKWDDPPSNPRKTHRIHGTAIYLCIYCKSKQPFMQVNIPYVDPSGNGLVNVVTVVITMVTYWSWNHPNLKLLKFDAWNYVQNISFDGDFHPMVQSQKKTLITKESKPGSGEISLVPIFGLTRKSKPRSPR